MQNNKSFIRFHTWKKDRNFRTLSNSCLRLTNDCSKSTIAEKLEIQLTPERNYFSRSWKSEAMKEGERIERRPETLFLESIKVNKGRTRNQALAVFFFIIIIIYDSFQGTPPPTVLFFWFIFYCRQKNAYRTSYYRRTANLSCLIKS